MAANVKGGYGYFGCVQNPEGKLLLVQRGWYEDRTTGEKKWDGRWNYPGGGVDENDAKASLSIEAIVAREVEEETGLQVCFGSHRPVGVYATANHSDVAVTWDCRFVGGELRPTDEGVSAKFFTPDEIMELAHKGDVPDGLVGGLKTSTGGVPRHIQMCLHFFTRLLPLTSALRQQAQEYCSELGISE